MNQENIFQTPEQQKNIQDIIVPIKNPLQENTKENQVSPLVVDKIYQIGLDLFQTKEKLHKANVEKDVLKTEKEAQKKIILKFQEKV